MFSKYFHQRDFSILPKSGKIFPGFLEIHQKYTLFLPIFSKYPSVELAGWVLKLVSCWPAYPMSSPNTWT
jgi:hypothetical protein